MQETAPQKTSYRIHYLECKQQGHEGQKLNFLCTSKSCVQSSLICSLCRYNQHIGHAVKPLKFYLEELRKKYETESQKHNQQLERLENTRASFLFKLKESVEKVAQEFMKFEQMVIEQFEALHNQILQNQNKQGLFKDLYHTLTEGKGDANPEQIIKLYLPQTKVKQVGKIEKLETLVTKFKEQIAQLRTTIIYQDHAKDGHHSPVLQHPGNLNLNLKFNLNHQYIVGQSITKLGNTFTQTNLSNDSMVLLNVKLSDFKGIRFKILQATNDPKMTLGVIKMDHSQSMAYDWKENSQNGIMWVSSNSKSEKQNFSHLAQFCVKGNVIDGKFKKGHMKFYCNKNTADFIIYGQPTEFYLFFTMKGNLKLEVQYPLSL